MSADMVKVYNEQTKTYSTMPVCELEQGFYKVMDEETGETHQIFVPATKSKRHTLSEDQRLMARKILRRMPPDVMPPLPPDGALIGLEFIEFIAHAENPDLELRVWKWIAGAYHRWTDGKALGLPKRKAVARCLCAFSLTGNEALRNPTSIFRDPDLPPKEVVLLAQLVLAEFPPPRAICRRRTR